MRESYVGGGEFRGGMVTVNRATVRALNALTARWARTAPNESGTVLAAAGVWPLLGLLAEGADEGVRDELVEALGLPPGRTSRAARGLLAALDAMEGVQTALGLWTRRELPLHESWSAKVPEGAHARLTGDPGADAAALDRWAKERTGGLIETMPVDLDPRTWLVLACALTLRTEWERPVVEGPLDPSAGPWQGRGLAGLSRSGRDLDEIGLAATPDGTVIALHVRGTAGIDVHLLLGDADMTPGQVLGTGVGLLDGTHTAEPGGGFRVGTTGPGLAVTERRTVEPGPRLDVRVPRFTVAAEHDLLAEPARFGLRTATDGSEQHFPGISPGPLRLRSARQSATAAFGRTGFTAAAVTALGMAWMGGSPEPRHTATVVTADFDRPFGFLAVHRPTRLALAAGWVTQPEPCDEGLSGG